MRPISLSTPHAAPYASATDAGAVASAMTSASRPYMRRSWRDVAPSARIIPIWRRRAARLTANALAMPMPAMTTSATPSIVTSSNIAESVSASMTLL